MSNLFIGKFPLGDQSKAETITLDGDNANITLGGNGHDGDILMKNSAGSTTVGINGQTGAVHLGGTGQDGDLLLRNSANTVTIRLDGQTGTIFIKDWSLSVPDFVFSEHYPLRDMESLRDYISEHGHLPDVPAAQEIARDGLNLTKFSMNLLQKIEEMALYAIEQERRLRDQQTRISRLEQALGLSVTL